MPQPKPLDKSIAVLPFMNMSSDKENDYLCDGMTEELINALAKIKGLKVTSRTSSFFFKGKNLPIPHIGQQLAVTIILEGSIRFSGNTMRITAQLIDVLDDYHFWSETFDRSLDDIFAVQDEISLLIADKLREHLGHFPIEASLITPIDISVPNYQLYLKSRYHLLKMTLADLEIGISISEQLIANQPNFPYAYLGVHMGYTLMGTLGFIPAVEGFMKGQPYLEQAIKMAPDLVGCQLQLSWIASLQEWDFPKAYQHIHKALEIRPSAEAYQTMSSILIAEGKFKAALNYINIAIQIDPLSGINHHLKGFIYYVQEQYDQALKHFEKSMELNPNALVSVLYYGQTLLLMKRYDQAWNYFEQLPPEKTDALQQLGGKTLTQAAKGHRALAEQGILKLEASLNSELMERALLLLISCETFLGNLDKAIDWVAQGIQHRLPLMIYLNVEPCLKPLHVEKRFQELMQQIFKEQPNVLIQKKTYKKSSLSHSEKEQYHQQLQTLMLQEQPYLQANLSLRQLAKALDLHPNKLSELLNEKIGKNFSAYINHYRIEYFKKLTTQSEYEHLSLLGLAYESGFNSKTSFNTFFKKETGLTPKQFLKQRSSEL